MTVTSSIDIYLILNKSTDAAVLFGKPACPPSMPGFVVVHHRHMAFVAGLFILPAVTRANVDDTWYDAEGYAGRTGRRLLYRHQRV